MASVDGVLGALVELVDVDEGLEAAFEAAAGEALSAVLMDTEEAARRGLAHLAETKAPGAVIALREPRPPETGVAAEAGGLLPEGAVWVRRAFVLRAAVTDLLDRLLVNAVAVLGDWSMAVDLAVARPELVVVTRAGDRCAGGIWRTGSHGTGATGTALEEARAAVREATIASEVTAAGERQARRSWRRRGLASSEARRMMADAAAAVRNTLEALQRAKSDMAEAEAEVLVLAAGEELAQRRGHDCARVAELEALVPELEAAADEESRRASPNAPPVSAWPSAAPPCPRCAGIRGESERYRGAPGAARCAAWPRWNDDWPATWLSGRRQPIGVPTWMP